MLKRFFIFWGMVLASVFCSLIGIVPNIYLLGICLILGSLGSGFFHPQATGFAGYYSGENITKNMGIFLACGTFGFALGPLISSSIADFLGLQYLPYIMSIGLICALLILKFVPKIKKESVSVKAEGLTDALKDILKDNTMRILIMISILKSFITTTFSLFPPFLWTEMGYSTFKIGVLVFLYLIFSGMGTFSSHFFEKRIGAINTFKISLMSTFPLALLYFITYKHYPVLSLIFYFMIGYFALLSVSINMVFAQKRMPKYKNIISGFIGGFSWGVVGIMLASFGFIAEHYGVKPLLIGISLVPFVCSYFLKYLNPKELNG